MTPRWSALADAIRKTKASARAIRAVRRLAADGLARIDEELWHELKSKNLYSGGLVAVQHARLALADAGFMERAPLVRLTAQDGRSWAWRWAGGAVSAGEFDALWSDPQWTAHVKAVKAAARSAGPAAGPNATTGVPAERRVGARQPWPPAQPTAPSRPTLARWHASLHRFCSDAQKKGLDAPDDVRELFWWLANESRA